MYNRSRESLLPHLLSKEMFQSMGEAALEELERELEWVEVAEGDALFHQGEAGDSMYVLVQGRLGVTVQQPDGSTQMVDVVEPGAPVGEIALLTGYLRTASVHALEDAGLIRLSRESLGRLAAKHPEAMSTLAQSIVPRLQQSQLVQALTVLFGALSPQALHDLQAEFEWRHLATGEELFRQGAPARALYIIVTGRLRFVLENPDGSPRAMGEIGPGESVGEVALLTGEPRSATVYAVRETDVVRLTRERFEQLAERYPLTMLNIAGHITRRLMHTIRAAPGATVRPATFAILPLTNHSRLAEITQRLVGALEHFGPTLHLNSERFNTYFGGKDVAQTEEDHPSDVALRGWLSRQESRHRYLLYEADNRWTPWTQRCLRQSDRILLVAETDSIPHLGEVGAAIQQMERPPHVELLLLHPPGRARAVGTERWLALGPFRAHHHVRVENREDVARIARRMTGRSVGLALGGGGARGFAHIGVIQALEEAGFEIDLVGGASMGSLVAAGYAAGLSPQEMTRLAKNFAQREKMFDYTFPAVALFSGHKLTALFQTLFGESKIEDLWRPFFCVSVDLKGARLVEHRQGLLWLAIRCSTSLPGVFPPVSYEGKLLSDGSILNTLPADLVRQEPGVGFVVAVNVSAQSEMLTDYAFGTALSGWKVLWNRLNPFAKRLEAPSLLSSLHRVTDVVSVNELTSRERYADLLLRPSVSHYGLLEFQSYEQIIEVGYWNARQQLEAWQRQQPTERNML